MTDQHTPAPFQPQPAGSPADAQSNPTTKGPKKAWYKRTWVVATATALVGLVIGAASAGADPTTTSEYKAVAKDLAGSKTDVKDLRADLQDTKASLDAAKAKLTEVEGNLPTREAAVKTAEDAVAKRERDVSAAEKDVAKREKKVGIVEEEIAANTLGGDGMYKVGAEMKPGTYKTAGSPGCYYAVLNSTDTFDIAVNNNIDGPGFATVKSGQYFETTNCADWVLQR